MTELENSNPMPSQEDKNEFDSPVFEIIDTGPKKERAVHLNKWLWAARFFKTKEIAGNAVKSGSVTYNYGTAHPNQEIYIGDIITIKYGSSSKTVIVTGLSTRRRNISEANKLYKEEQKKPSSNRDRGESHSKGNRRNKRYEHKKPANKKHKVQVNAKQDKNTQEEPNYNREHSHSQQQFPSDFATQHFLDRAQKWYDEPDAEDD